MSSLSLARSAAAKRTFHSLDGLRGIAAILVVAFHYQRYVTPFLIGSGYLAVDVFFVLSGFVIALAYEEKLRTQMSAGRFLVARLVRLYPMYFLGTVVSLVVPAVGLLLHVSRLWTWSDWASAAIPALFMLPRPPAWMVGSSPGFIPYLYPLNAPAWSLFFEIFINIVYAATLGIRTRWFLPLVLAASALGIVISYVCFGHGQVGGGWEDWWGGPPRVAFSFFLGVLFYRLHAAETLPKLRFPPLLSFAAVAAILCAAPAEGWQRITYDLVCVLIVLPFLVWLCICNEPHHGVRWFAALGLLSYPLYAIHQPFGYLVDRVVDRVLHQEPGNFAPWIGILFVLIFVGFSWLLALTYDIWARKRLGALVGQAVPRVP